MVCQSRLEVTFCMSVSPRTLGLGEEDQHTKRLADGGAEPTVQPGFTYVSGEAEKSREVHTGEYSRCFWKRKTPATERFLGTNLEPLQKLAFGSLGPWPKKAQL